MSEGLWKLYDDANKLDSASTAWTDVAQALDSASDRVNAKAKQVRDIGWEGETAKSYDAHRKEVVTSLDSASTLAGSIASTLSLVAGSVRTAQGRLDAQWATVVGIPHQGSPSGDIRFQTESDEEAARVNGAIKVAHGIRTELDKALATDTTALHEARAAWDKLAAQWLSVADGSTDGWKLPEDVDPTGVITDGNKTIVNAGGGDDKISVFIDPFTGEQLVSVNGKIHRLPAGQEIVIRGGGGNDTIEVPKGTHLNLTLIGSEGDDHINGGAGDDKIFGLDGDDEVDAGGGNDRVSGGADRDYLNSEAGDDIVSGGLGDDTVYGLDGNDQLSGGEGQDYLEGGKGDDTLAGGDGNDILSGGRDNDTILGGAGADVSYAGRGDDTTFGGSGNDTAHNESGDRSDGTEHNITVQIPDTARFIKIEGSPEFVARVEADLDMLRSSPSGHRMLEALQRAHDDSGGWFGIGKENLTISEYPDNTNSSADPDNNDIKYAPRLDWISGAPPVAVLYHEMAHVYDFMYDNYDDTPYSGDDATNHGVDQGERVAAGLPVDHDHDPSTPEIIDPDHAFELSENGLRREMGAPHRDHY
jgi:uncharacterized protein YukE